jgi:16S rRNA (uracil1498-N3)-methyltransferase
MRAKVGDEVILFDGTGPEFIARIETLGRSTAELVVLSRREISRELPLRLCLSVALPKGDRQRWMVEKATELGVARLVPLVTTRGVAQPEGAAISRLRRTVIEASKQCGRNRLMEIAEPQSWFDFATAVPPESVRFIAHPCEHTPASARRSHPPALPGGDVLRGNAGEIIFAIGPEGGFTDDEVQRALDAGWRPIGLGPRILRVETAAVALAACAALGFLENET